MQTFAETVSGAVMDQTEAQSGHIAPASDPPPVNDRTLRLFVGNDSSLRDSLLQQFLEEVTLEVEILSTSLQTNDQEKFLSVLYRAKGASLMVGADHFVALLRRLEQLDRSAALREHYDTIEALGAEVQRLRRFVEQRGQPPSEHPGNH